MMMAPPQGYLYFYHPDHLGTSTFLTDANGDPYQFFLNLPFGETMAEQHSQTEDYETQYKFNGKELDAETGMYYYGARYYDPRVSIWMSTDPLMEKYPEFNPYVYCLNNPINFVDPDGLDPTPHPKSGIGSINYYIYRHLDFVKQNPGKKAPDYYLNYGNKYIRAFSNETSKSMSGSGKVWLKEARKNLQVAMEDRLNPKKYSDANTIEFNNDAFRKFAFDFHVDAYWNENGTVPLYKLNAVDLTKILLTPDAKDLTSADGLRQVKDMMSKFMTEKPEELTRI